MTPPYPSLTGAEPCLTGSPDRFFPTAPNSTAQAAAECRTCPTRDPCFAWAVHHAVEGVWNSTENQRKSYQRTHGIVPQQLPTAARLIAANVYRMADRGLGPAEIARHFDVSAEAVGSTLRKRRAAS